jgi:hypothetical protein
MKNTKAQLALCMSVLAAMIAGSGCGRVIAKRINRQFPPVSTTDQQLAAVRENVANLSDQKSPDAYIKLTVDDLNQHLNPILEGEGIDSEFAAIHLKGSRTTADIQQLSITRLLWRSPPRAERTATKVRHFSREARIKRSKLSGGKRARPSLGKQEVLETHAVFSLRLVASNGSYGIRTTDRRRG